MNLTKLILNPYSREARRDLASSYDLHRTLVTKGFPDGKSDSNRMLFRIEPPTPGRREPGVVVLVQCSGGEPDWTHLPEDYCASIEGPRIVDLRQDNNDPVFTAGQHLAFRLVANPVRRMRTGERSTARPDKPAGHARYRREAILDEEEQHAWLVRQGTDRGFRPLFIHTTTFGLPRHKPENVSDKTKKSIPHVGVRFDGLLQVTEPERFLLTLEEGIGAAKAFGFGLLSIARPM